MQTIKSTRNKAISARWAAERRICKQFGIPKCIRMTPDEKGEDTNDLSNWAYIVRHEIDLYEEDQDSPDIKTRAQYNAAKKALIKLQAVA